MRPPSPRDRLQLAGAPDHVRLLVTLFSVTVVIAELLLVVPVLLAPPSTTTAAPLEAAGQSLLLLALSALALSALVGATALPTSARIGYSAAAFLAALLHALVPTAAGLLGPSAGGAPAVTGAFVALCAIVGAGLVIRGAWSPAPVIERETVWPERRPRPGDPARPRAKDGAA